MEFWKFIEAHAATAPSLEAASAALAAALKDLGEEDVLEYCQAFDAAMDKAYTWDLWGVAYLINGGCSDDTFMDFRAGLIACGQNIFESAVADAQSLMSIPESNLSALFEEGLLYVGPTVYTAMSSKTPERRPSTADPTGEPWEETRDDLMQRFPIAWSKYGWEEQAIVSTPRVTSEPKKPWWKFW